MKKAKSTDEKLEDFVTETLKEKNKPIGINTLLDLDTVDNDPEMTPEEEAAIISFDRIPSDSGMYVKVFKRGTDDMAGQKIFLADIYKPENHADISSELMRRAILEGWGSGEYILQLMQERIEGVKDEKIIPLQVPVNKDSNKSENSFETSVDHMAKLSKVMEQLNPKGKMTPPPPATNPNEMLDVVSKAMMTGINAGKEVNKPTSQGQSPDVLEIIKTIHSMKEKPAIDTGELLKTVIALVANMAQQNKAVQSTTPNDPLKMFSAMKEMGLVGNSQPVQTENDMDKFMKFMVLMKKINPDPPPAVDPMEKSIGLLTSMLPLVKEMSGGETSSSSVGVEIAKQLLPSIPQMVNDVATTIQTTVKAKRDIMAGGMRKAPKEGRKGFRSRAKKLFSKETLIVPQLKPLAEAVKLSDPTYFPEVTQLLGSQIGEEGILQIIRGEITIQDIQNKIRPYSGGFFDSQAAINYFHTYIQYLRNQYEQNMKAQKAIEKQSDNQEEEEITAERNAAFTGTCEACGEIYGVETESEFDDPATSTCVCGGRVLKNTPESQQEVEIISPSEVLEDNKTAIDMIEDDNGNV